MSTISKVLRQWYSEHKRDLPWRVTTDPYLIWLSEIILQQTRVNQGLEYYLKFKEAFPSVKDLAEADLDHVLKLWQGLGYYSRARNLHTSAKQVVEHHNGKFPNTYNELITLKGVGAYTAAAVSSFSSNESRAVVDGNVYRVLARLFNEHTPINSTTGTKLFSRLAIELLPQGKAAEHNQAIMEFGALQCTPKKPNCMYCPLQNQCLSFQHGNVIELPKKQGKTKVTDRFFYFFINTWNNRVYVEKRIDKGIWQQMYQFQLVELDNANEIERAIAKSGIPKQAEVERISEEIKHILSHQRLHIRFIRVKHNEKPPNLDAGKWVNEDEFHSLAIPRAIDRYLKSATSIF